MSVTDITDRTPNSEAIDQLRYLLEEAEAGRLRSFFSVSCWEDSAVSHGWVLDPRSSRRAILAEMVMAQHDFTVNLELTESHSILASALGE